MSPEDIERVDAWRARQPGVPGRPEAIRQLIQLGLEAARSSDEPPSYDVGPASAPAGKRGEG
jgi:hypothetical protein